MKFLTNTFNPNNKDARLYTVREENQTLDEAWKSYQRFLQGKIIGLPQATSYHTVEELVSMNMVGLYTENE